MSGSQSHASELLRLLDRWRRTDSSYFRPDMTPDELWRTVELWSITNQFYYNPDTGPADEGEMGLLVGLTSPADEAYIESLARALIACDMADAWTALRENYQHTILASVVEFINDNDMLRSVAGKYAAAIVKSALVSRGVPAAVAGTFSMFLSTYIVHYKKINRLFD